MFIIADENMSVQWHEHFQVLHGIQGRTEIKFLICGISKPIISYTRMTATGCGGWDGVSFSYPESTGIGLSALVRADRQVKGGTLTALSQGFRARVGDGPQAGSPDWSWEEPEGLVRTEPVSGLQRTH